MSEASGGASTQLKHAVLDHDEVIALARCLQTGRKAQETLRSSPDHPDHARLMGLVAAGEAAKTRLVTHNLRLVLSVTSAFKVDGLTAEDLFQEGVLGLMHGIERFDPERGFQLSTYVTWWIRQSVQRAIAEKARLIRLPVHIFERVRAVAQAKARLMQSKGFASLDDLVDATRLQPSEVRDAIRLAPGQSSLDELVGDGLSTLGDLQPEMHSPGPEDLAMQSAEREAVDDLVSILSERERDVLRLRFGLEDDLEHTLEQIGRAYGVTRERIRQIEAKAIEKLRKHALPAMRENADDL